jgi:hypothetical protein
MVQNRTNYVFIVAGVVVFALVGLWFGRPPELAPLTFGDILIQFSQDNRTRILLFAILVDVVTGIIGASRMGTADAQRTGAFFDTNILRYVLGYLLFYCITIFGLDGVLPEVFTNTLASLGYGAAMTSLTASIIDNSKRASFGSAPTEADHMYAEPLTPSDRG